MQDQQWIAWLRSHLGEPEVTGAPPTDFDRSVFKHTNYGDLGKTMVPGCAATACAALEESGMKSTKSAAAISFANYGQPCEIQPGAILVFQWMNGEHHVSFCDHIVSDQLVAAIGGNQSHRVSIANFDRKFLIAIRWPVVA